MTTTPELVLALNIDPGVFIVLLYLPIITTIISFARYVVGLNSLGAYAPIALTYSFFFLGFNYETNQSDAMIGLKYGLILSAVVFAATIFSYKFIQPMAMHYYAKLSIVVTNVVVAILSVLVIAKELNLKNFIALDAFTLVLIATIAERFLNIVAFNKNIKKAIKVSLSTVFIAAASYLFITIQPIQNALTNYPWLIVINIPLAYLVGSFAGLRLTEYYRFRDILNQPQPEK